MSDYVIDENVLINAVTGEKPVKKGDEKSMPADAEKVFIYSFFSNRDRNFINYEIRKKFFKMPEKIEQKFKKEILDNQVIPRFLSMLSNSDKITIIEGIKNDFKGVKNCDTEFVGVTLQSNATLVTADKDLQDAIKKDNFVSKCKCATVEEILEKKL